MGCYGFMLTPSRDLIYFCTMKYFYAILVLLLANVSFSQSVVKGTMQTPDKQPVMFANVILFSASDSSVVKVETTSDSGEFVMMNINYGNYYLLGKSVGLEDLIVSDIKVNGPTTDLGVLNFADSGDSLGGLTVVAERDLVEVKPDRTVFNVEGTVNSVGSNALQLLRKAPSVTVDNNDNINIMGRAGVMVYIDGKRLPLAGEDLANFLKNLPAEQIDRIEIITSPGAKYDAEGNAGIVDIRLKKDKSIGANGSLSGTYTRGDLTRYNINGSGNYRNKKMNVYGSAGYSQNDNLFEILAQNYQNGIALDEYNYAQNNRNMFNYRLGSDFFLNRNHTIGFLVSGATVDGELIGENDVNISDANTPNQVDSVLIANSSGNSERLQGTYNLNYSYLGDSGQVLTMDLDYGNYTNTDRRFQPNVYYTPDQQTVLEENVLSFNTPNEIDIYTAKLDYEQKLGKGKFGIGGKYSKVVTKNTFEVFDVLNSSEFIDNSRSNKFDYDENVYAGYLSYAARLGKRWSLTSGVRGEYTKSTGDLVAYDTSKQEDPVNQEYFNLFPSVGLLFNFKPKQSLGLNYGRRINRPDYNVLNPFRNQLSEVSIEKGNAFLRPEIVNNVELSYTLFYMYTFKLGYSRTTNAITRLIGPDDVDPRAMFVSWDNLSTQDVYSANISLPLQIKKWWQAFINLSASYLDNQADYGDGAIVDVQVFTYNMFQSHTFNLPKAFKLEVSGFVNGPGVWGGVYKYDANYQLNLGLQRKFLKDALKVRVSYNNITNRKGFYGTSSFNGLVSESEGRWDNRFFSISASYNFGNQNIKSRKRKTGIEDEKGRVGE